MFIDKLHSKFSLSPQRRSFQRGCSWKEKVGSGSQGDPGSSPTAASPLSSSLNDSHFSFDHQKFHGVHGNSGGHGNSGSHGTSNKSLPRGVHRGQMRDREHNEDRRENRRNWESSRHDDHRNKSRNYPNVCCDLFAVVVYV